MEIDADSIQLELKYCERCGGLWLRLKGSDLVFCAACAIAMLGLRNGRSRTSPSSPDRRGSQTQTAFWGEGGNA